MGAAMNRRLSLGALVAGFLLGCADGPADVPWQPTTLSGAQACLDSARPDTVRAASFNLSIGFRVEDLLFIDQGSDSVLLRRVRGIFSDADRSLPRERIRRVAQEIAAVRPDVVGLQECLRLERNGRVVVDMLDTLRADLAALGMADWTLLPHPMNPVDVVVRIPGGDSERVVFHEGLAVLHSPRWTTVHDDLFPYRSVLSIDLIGRRATSERAAQGVVLRRDDGFRLEAWNTHLEVLPYQRRNQATELAFVADSLRWIRRAEGPSGRLLLGDLNSNPGVEADSLLSGSGWRDAWTDARVRNRDTGATCCVGDNRSASGGYRTTGRRIDYVRHQGACAVDSARLHLDDWFLTPVGDTLWTSDHALVYARLVYGIRR